MRNRSGVGRPSKGPRDHFVVKPTTAVGDLIRQDAEREDVSYNDILVRIVAEHYGLPAFNDIGPARQEPLLMTG